jgi:hypothetical protein
MDSRVNPEIIVIDTEKAKQMRRETKRSILLNMPNLQSSFYLVDEVGASYKITDKNVSTTDKLETPMSPPLSPASYRETD